MLVWIIVADDGEEPPSTEAGDGLVGRVPSIVAFLRGAVVSQMLPFWPILLKAVLRIRPGKPAAVG